MTPREFLRTEAAGGAVLLAGTAIALAWANSPWQGGYRSLFDGGARHAVNEGLMAIFFFVVGLEIRREITSGELRAWRSALLPAVGALGGMVVPALLYLAATAGDSDAAGAWGIPMATDIAFAVGVLALAGRRLPPSLRVFLLTLAIVDDLGAIVVIAVAYSGGVQAVPLVAAGALLAAIALLARAGATWAMLHAALGLAVWAAVAASGVHATIAGAAVAFLLPVALTGRAEQLLHPVSSFGVVPLFALANAGVTIGGSVFGAPGAGRVAGGVVLGLVVGKPLGIAGFAWLATRLHLAERPPGTTWAEVVGVAATAGIGFTISLLIADLGFGEGRHDLVGPASTAVLGASVASAALGAAILAGCARRRSGPADDQLRP